MNKQINKKYICIYRYLNKLTYKYTNIYIYIYSTYIYSEREIPINITKYTDRYSN